MTWTYEQATGELTRDGAFVGTGYSGTGMGRDNTAFEATEGVGPIPRGQYTIGPVRNSARLGPCVMNLEPSLMTDTFGRSLFRIHGDNRRNDASHGCIILGPLIRQAIADSGDTDLEVV